jgi:D-sedoheptulose 7-phosphate isomerase
MNFYARIEKSVANLKRFDEAYVRSVDACIGELVSAFRSGHKLLVCGNGGSAADAQHICGELVGRFHLNRAPLSAIALTSDSSVLTAWSNDFEYDTVFSRQIEAHGKPGDVALGITTSGNSTNVVRAMEQARKLGMRAIGLTGASGGAIAGHCHIVLSAPATATPEIQELHMVTYHFICAEVERQLFT